MLGVENDGSILTLTSKGPKQLLKPHSHLPAPLYPCSCSRGGVPIKHSDQYRPSFSRTFVHSAQTTTDDSSNCAAQA